MHGVRWFWLVLGLAIGARADARGGFAGEGFDRIGRLTVQHEGRWMPLRTLARDVLWRLTGEESFEGEDPVGTLLAMTFEPQRWSEVALVRVASARLSERLGLSAGERLSFAMLADSEELRLLLIERERLGEQDRKRGLWSAVAAVEGQRALLGRALRGALIRPVPVPGEGLGAWRSVGWLAGPGAVQAPEVAALWGDLQSAFVDRERGPFDAAAADLVPALDALPRELGPAPERIDLEADFEPHVALAHVWQLLFGGAACAIGWALARRRWLQLSAGLLLFGGWALLARLLWMRGLFAERLPATNMYESLLWLALGAAAMAALVFVVTQRGLVPALSAALAGVAVLAAEGSGLDPFIRPAPAVLLDTAWMSFHVPVTMFAYALLGLAVLLAHGQLLVLAFGPERSWSRAMERRLVVAMHAGSALLFLGIASGSMWAASSWGRAWGWDPKEVWSLIALLAYMVILHVRLDHERVPRSARAMAALAAAATLATILVSIPDASPLVMGLVLSAAVAVAFLVLARGQLALALKVLVAFWMVVITYVAVNFVLAAGLHSYGFGQGSAGRGLAWAAGLELLFVAMCCAMICRRDLTPRAALPLLDGSD